MFSELKIRAQAAPWRNAVELFIVKMEAGVAYPCSAIEFSSTPFVGSDPAMGNYPRLSMTEAQTLMDDLWNAGLRPTEGSGSAGALSATQRHLEDMRALVFKKEVRA